MHLDIQNALLSLLSVKPMTGYDLKKVMQESAYMHWSGNNNQIYKALLALQEEGLAVCETRLQEGAPSKKVYTVTQEGRGVLKSWLRSAASLARPLSISIWTHPSARLDSSPKSKPRL